MHGRAVLCVAGLDPTGGAGLAVDLRVVREQELHPAPVCTAVTAQGSAGVTWLHPVPPEGIRAQVAAVLETVPVAAVKVGMLGHVETAAALVAALAVRPDLPLVWDPVLRASSGGSLLQGDRAGLAPLLARASLVTPNLAEVGALGGAAAAAPGEMAAAGAALLARGPGAVLVTGGHLAGEPVDVLVTPEGTLELPGSRIGPGDVRGTGCALSTAIACRLALGDSMDEAVRRGRSDLRRRLVEQYGLGGGARYLG